MSEQQERAGWWCPTCRQTIHPPSQPLACPPCGNGSTWQRQQPSSQPPACAAAEELELNLRRVEGMLRNDEITPMEAVRSICMQHVEAINTLRASEARVANTEKALNVAKIALDAHAELAAARDQTIQRLLACFHQPNPTNPDDWRVAPGKGQELSALIAALTDTTSTDNNMEQAGE